MELSRKNVIYMDIESFYDMRQGFLAVERNDHKRTMLEVSSDEFNNRRSDEFPKLPKGAYREAIQSGNKEILRNATISHNFYTLINAINECVGVDTGTNQIRPIEIWINIHPFEMSQDEVKLFKNLLFAKLKKEVFIEIIDVETAELTPDFISNNNIRTLFIYNYNVWVDAFLTEIESGVLKDTNFYFPDIYPNEPDEEDIELLKKCGFETRTGVIEFALSSYLKLNFLPVVFYTNTLIAASILESLNAEIRDEIEERWMDEDEAEAIIDGYLGK